MASSHAHPLSSCSCRLHFVRMRQHLRPGKQRRERERERDLAAGPDEMRVLIRHVRQLPQTQTPKNQRRRDLALNPVPLGPDLSDRSARAVGLPAARAQGCRLAYRRRKSSAGLR